jgi:hypothetical protein
MIFMEFRYNEVTIGNVNKWRIEGTGNCSQYHHEIQIAFWFKSDAPLSFPKVVLWGQMCKYEVDMLKITLEIII